jgi:hypothetical protein
MLHWTRNHRKRNTKAIRTALDRGIIVVRDDEIFNAKGLRLLVRANAYGYPCVRFYLDGTQYHCYAHKIVWMAYGGAIKAGYEIDHINADNTDYRHENLRLISQEKNLEKSFYSDVEAAF